MCKNMDHSFKIERTVSDIKSINLEMTTPYIKNDLNAEISIALNNISVENIKAKLIKLSSYHTRHTKSKYINEAADWLKNEFESIGYEDVLFHEFIERMGDCEYKLKNIVCNKKGNNRKSIIICAHYDSRMEAKSDHISRAPGANDNASGVSAILEIARVLYDKKLECDLQFVLFPGEEQRFLGSEQYAKLIRKNNIRLYRLINLDMIGYPQLNPGKVIIERDNNKNYKEHNRVISNDKRSIECGKIMIKNTYRYTNLIPVNGSIYDSDYKPFEKRGYVVVGVYDGSAEIENEYYHSINDTHDKIDWDYLTSVTKIVMATILTLDEEIRSNVN